jgi:WG containing repeat/DnaJ domain
MLEELHSAYAVLGLDPSAGPEEVRAAYLDFVKILHPDRYHNEPERLRLRAERKLKEVTEAYRKLDGAICIELAPDPIPMDFGERWGYIGESGETRIHPQFDTARNFRAGLAAVQVDGKWGFIDSEGKFRINLLYEDCGDFSEGLAAVRWHGRWGYIDSSGSFAILPRFQDAKAFENGRAGVRLGARAGWVFRDGTTEFDPVHSGRHIGGAGQS